MATPTSADATTTTLTPGESAEPGATDAAGMLDFYEPGALGMVRRFWPESSMVRYAARLAGRPRTVTRRAGQLAAELAGIAKGSSQIAPQRPDRRFSDPAWNTNPLLRRTFQTYLALGRSAQDLLADAELGWRDNTRLKFVLTNLIAASAPSNNPYLSPAAWKAAHRHRRPEPRPRCPCLRLRHGLCPAHPHHGGTRRVPGRQGPRGDPGVGGGPHRGLRAHPVPAGHAHRAPVPAAHGPADDQQVLHHRHRARPQHDRVLRLPGIPGIRDLLAQPRPAGQGLGPEHLRRCGGGFDRRGPRDHQGAQGQHHRPVRRRHPVLHGQRAPERDRAARSGRQPVPGRDAAGHDGGGHDGFVYGRDRRQGVHPGLPRPRLHGRAHPRRGVRLAPAR